MQQMCVPRCPHPVRIVLTKCPWQPKCGILAFIEAKPVNGTRDAAMRQSPAADGCPRNIVRPPVVICRGKDLRQCDA